MAKLSLKLESHLLQPQTSSLYCTLLHNKLTFLSETVQLSEDSFNQTGHSHHLDSNNCVEEEPLLERSAGL